MPLRVESSIQSLAIYASVSVDLQRNEDDASRSQSTLQLIGNAECNLLNDTPHLNSHEREETKKLVVPYAGVR
jgi:hypothetical protein